MFERFIKPGYVATTFACLLFVAAGCEKSEPAAAPAGADASAIEAKLAAADAVDGTTDKIISKCPACNLSMDGSSEHELVAHGYTLHFCSAECKDHFAADVDKAIMEMQVPAK